MSKQTRLEALTLAVATTHDPADIMERAVTFDQYIEDGVPDTGASLENQGRPVIDVLQETPPPNQDPRRIKRDQRKKDKKS